jgi:glycosyltransferase involved in cell wall biosynthesis
MQNLPTVSVVVATLKRPQVLAAALQSAVQSVPPPYEVLVVDGDEAGSAADVVRTVGATTAVPLRHVPSPRGLTRQRNVGLDALRGDVVLFIDDDARLQPDALGRVATAFAAEPDVVGVTGRVVEPASNAVGGKSAAVRKLLPGGGGEGRFTRYGYPNRLVDEHRDHEVEFMAGCFMSARAAVAREVRFDEELPGYGLAEDEDFSYRLSRRGRIRYLADAVVEHDNGGFGGRDRRVFGRQVVRNRAYLFRKNFPQTRTAQAQFGLLLALLVLHRLLNRDLQGARGIVEGALVLASSGARPA